MSACVCVCVHVSVCVFAGWCFSSFDVVHESVTFECVWYRTVYVSTVDFDRVSGVRLRCFMWYACSTLPVR